MENIKVGVVGCGRIGKLHINNLINSIDGAEVIAVADPMIDTSGARAWCAERNLTSISADYMDVINNPEVDAVFVCSSTDTHSEISLAAAKAGKHIFRDKPVAVGAIDGLCAVLMAEAATQSQQQNGQWIKIPE